MKKIIMLTLVLLLGFTMLSAQNTQRVKFHTQVRDSTGNILSNQNVNLDVSILQGDPEGEEVYSESFASRSDESGFVTLPLQLSVSDSTGFGSVNWDDGPFFIVVKKNERTLMVSEMLSFPQTTRRAEPVFEMMETREENTGGQNENSKYDRPSGPGWEHNGNSIFFNGRVGIKTSQPMSELDVRGTIRTDVLVITAGNGRDMGEYINVSEPEALPYGSVVVMDATGNGAVKLSTKAYDPLVAGVLCNGGGLQPGVILGTPEPGNLSQVIAIAGRVYVRASSVNGPVKPGDLLTSSDIPGVAMLADDYDRARGCTIGKAMSFLTSGEGLVLVLISNN